MVQVMDSEWDNGCSMPLKPHQEDNHGSGSSNDSNPHFDSDNNTSVSSSSDRSSKNSETAIPAFNIFNPFENFRALPSSESSSAASSDDLFQVIPTPNINVHGAGELNVQSQASSKDSVFRDSSAKPDEMESESSGPTSTSIVSNTSQESALHTLSPTQSPPVQVMDRSGGYEPYRIPSLVFARSKSSSPIDWSIASNESLFSIQLGNNSFSRDHAIMWGDDLLKSEEPRKSSELIQFSPQPPGEAVAKVTESDTNDVEKIFKANQRSIGFVQENDDSRIKGQTANNTAGPLNSSRHSDESGTSVQSFTFPILTEVDRSNLIKLDTKKYKQQLQYEQQHVVKPADAPSSRLSSKRCCGSCRSSCCCCRSCCSRWPCCSCRSCCSCSGCYSSFSCCLRACCCRCC